MKIIAQRFDEKGHVYDDEISQERLLGISFVMDNGAHISASDNDLFSNCLVISCIGQLVIEPRSTNMLVLKGAP
jgi:hypothetical protein